MNELKRKELYCKMRYWEYEVGEEFLDYNEIVFEKDLLDWMKKNNYVNESKYNYWIEALKRSPFIEISDMFYYDTNSIFKKYDKAWNITKEFSKIVDKDAYIEIYMIAGIIADYENIYLYEFEKAFEEYQIESYVPENYIDKFVEEFETIETYLKSL